MITCPYCGKHAVLKNLKCGMAWVCSGFPECDSYVGAHGKTLRPKGTLANGELRSKRREAHSYFDQLWKTHRQRSRCYEWLSNELGIPWVDTHIAMFDVAMCDKTIEITKRRLGQ